MKSRQLAALLGVVLALTLWPSEARAQVSSITGVVRDSSGAVLPGVTVEAASPALIEKVRVGCDRRSRTVPARGSAPRRVHA